jgi:hypothetical protein
VISSGPENVTIVEIHAATALLKAIRAHSGDRRQPHEKLAAIPLLFHDAFAEIFDSTSAIEADVGRRGVWFIEAVEESLSRVTPEAVGPRYRSGLGYGLGLGLGVPLMAGAALGSALYSPYGYGYPYGYY